ncbi:MAG: TTAGGG repeat binding factor [Icmadophila ericetorum]|nr:TTAGGG repeat binding factor [Icmadophila ericetorum]
MVTTRGRRPVLEVAEKSRKPANGAATDLSPAPAVKLGTPDQSEQPDKENGTIGSRVGKRKRRSGSTHERDLGPAPKRGTSQQAKSSEKTRGPNKKEPAAVVKNGKHAAVAECKSGLALPTQPLPLRASKQDPQAQVSAGDQPQDPDGPVQADLAAVIAHIIHHSEQVGDIEKNKYGMQDGPVPGADLDLKIRSLPILDNLATQILNTLAKSTYQEILDILNQNGEDESTYKTLKDLFDHTRRVYSVAEAFLNPAEIGLTDEKHIEIIRKANLATFVSSVFGSCDVGFYHLNEYFLDTFVPDGARLLKSQSGLYLDLKTQAYISAMQHGEQSKAEILEDLFPADLEQRLLKRRPGEKQLPSSEAEFISRARNRAQSLLKDSHTKEAIEALPLKYEWDEFLKSVSTYVSKNFESLVGVPVRYAFTSAQLLSEFKRSAKRIRKITRDRPSNVVSFNGANNGVQKQIAPPPPMMLPVPIQALSPPKQPKENGESSRQDKPPSPPSNEQPTPAEPEQPQKPKKVDDIAAKAARAAQFAIEGFHTGQQSQQPNPYHPQQPPHFQHPPPNLPRPPQMQYPPPPQPPLAPFPHPQFPQHPYPHQQQDPQMHPPPHQKHQMPHLPPPHPQYPQHYQPRLPHPQPHYPHPQQMQFQHPMHPHHPHIPGYYVPHQIHGWHGPPVFHMDPNGIPYPTQSAPTQVLYERARQAATAKASPSNRRAGAPSQRRPWTLEEENALMAGLDRVKGPHWSQILAMYGPGGTISEVLKDRNQVQLKDKARNLKLFFLKSGIEVPYYLQFVTGELKTRAPALQGRDGMPPMHPGMYQGPMLSSHHGGPWQPAGFINGIHPPPLNTGMGMPQHGALYPHYPRQPPPQQQLPPQQQQHQNEHMNGGGNGTPGAGTPHPPIGGQQVGPPANRPVSGKQSPAVQQQHGPDGQNGPTLAPMVQRHGPGSHPVSAEFTPVNGKGLSGGHVGVVLDPALAEPPMANGQDKAKI